MRRAAHRWRAENWADLLPRTLRLSEPPVDLFAAARLRQVQRLGLRFMVPRGLLLPVEGGFEVYLRDTARKDFDVDTKEPLDVLSPRQRFTLAHEIAHTLFYTLSAPIPLADGTVSNGFALERICNEAAGYIVAPTELLKREIDDYERIDAQFVRSIAARFRVSLTVALERLCAVQPLNPFERCVILAHRVHGDAEIRALYCGVGLLTTLPRPVKFTRVTEWMTDFPRDVIEMRQHCEWKTTRMGRPVVFEKTELAAGDGFLLQAQVTRPVTY